MAESLCSFHIRGTAIFKVGPAGLDAILESSPLNIAELLRGCIPAAAIVVWVVLSISLLRVVLGRTVLVHGHGACSHAFPEVRESRLVAAAEAFAVFVAGGLGYRRIAELHDRVHVRGALAFEVSTAGLDAILEPSPLNIAELLRRRIPAAAIMVWADLGLAVLGNKQGGGAQGEHKRWKGESNKLH
jgi:hypothetical protein